VFLCQPRSELVRRLKLRLLRSDINSRIGHSGARKAAPFYLYIRSWSTPVTAMDSQQYEP
jgi:hypothetical protein